MRRLVAVLVLCLSLLPAAPRAAPSEASRRLSALLAEEWERHLREDPVSASLNGDRRFADRWEDLSLRALAARKASDQAALEQLRRIERAQLTAAEQLNYDLFQREVSESLEAHELHHPLLLLEPRDGPHLLDAMVPGLRFDTEKDVRDWITRLRRYPELLGQVEERLREGVRRGVTQPKVLVRRVMEQLERQPAAPERSGFYEPFTRLPPLPAQLQAALRREGRAAVEEAVGPALQRLRRYLGAEYLPACSEDVGLWRRPDGAAAYAFYARKYTTTRLTPPEIHAIGLREVARLRAEMEGVRQRVGFRGDLPAFFQHLRSDPRYFYRSGGELLTAYRALAKRIDPHLVRLFGKLPRMPYGVEPIPASSAPEATTAYYSRPAADGSRAGTYFVNLYKPEARPRWEMMALSLHESVPGHHLQIALSQELGELPAFRRYGYYSAFGEGWGLYAESLGDELGLYEDPYDKFGQLTYDMWRSVRLVVDTGMHAQRWTREQAIRYFLDNAAKTETDVINEVDRYIAWPGQALSYKIGQLKLRELRARAQQRLGARFDLRRFHDLVLSEGAIPLELLERLVDAWIRKAAG